MTNVKVASLKIEMVHDMVCSWCPIGYYNLKNAIETLGINAELNFLPFELNPHMPEEGQSIQAYFQQQFRWTENKLKQYQSELVNTASKSGVTIDFAKRTHYYNTHSAHKLMHWVQGFDKQAEFNEHLIKAYFELGLDIGQTEVLMQLIKEIGLDPSLAKLALENPQIEQALRDKTQYYMAFNVTSIPTFILDGHYLLSGSSSVAELTQQIGEYIKSKAA